MLRTRFFLTTTALLLAATAPTALAQFQSGGGGRGGAGGGFGSGGGGSSSFGTTGFGSSGFGSSGFGTTGFGSSGFGSSGFGSSGFGGGFGSGGFGSSGFGSSGFGGGGFGQSGFGGAGGGQTFVGRDAGDMQSVFNQLGRSSNQFMQQLNRTIGGGNRNRQRNQQNQEENAELMVRVKLNVAFDHARPQPAAVASTVRARLNSILERRNIAAPDVEIVGDAVVLRGTAASESERLVIEKLVSIEPGVSEVRNEMTVAGSLPVPPQDND